MARVALNITVDGDLLRQARECAGTPSDPELLDQALAALIAQSEKSDPDVRAWQDNPLDAPDAWGDLASWGRAVHPQFR
ncbi:hypothetical protein [Aestuariimicrobium ganziense]|uniref:hypothetical protein n=1 Tax=Aestuariimicrobium ganziense TaxID=2773677 RepID=UPI0019407DE0|nr:hypothetical protein [Aestuariimicrobium ganziense]